MEVALCPVRLAILPALFVGALLACGEPQAEVSPSDSPTSGSPPPGCTGDLAVTKVQALFDALDRGDDIAAVAMFPAPGSAAVVIQPELEFADVPPFPPGKVHQASNPDELRSLVRAATGYRIRFIESPHSSAKRIDYLVGGKRVWVWTAEVSQNKWQAVGPGGTFAGSGSKIAFNCESGKFLRVLL